MLLRETGNPLVYAVEDLRPSTSLGDMIFGVTRMMPGKVGEEYFVTRGHLHAVANRPEIYYGESGTGLMLLESLLVASVGLTTPPFSTYRKRLPAAMIARRGLTPPEVKGDPETGVSLPLLFAILYPETWPAPASPRRRAWSRSRSR